MRSVVFASSFALLAATSVASAGLVNPFIPSWAGSANTQFAQWDSFTQASGGPNAPDSAGSSPFSLFNFAPGALITGSGNIYSQTSALYIMIMGGSLGNAATPTDIVMNVATAGSVMDTGSVKLSIFDNAGHSAVLSPTSAELRADAPVPPQGSAQTWAFSWSIGNLGFAATGFRIEFLASAPSMSLDAVRLDMGYSPVPAPGAIALLAIAGIPLARRRRR